MNCLNFKGTFPFSTHERWDYLKMFFTFDRWWLWVGCFFLQDLREGALSADINCGNAKVVECGLREFTCLKRGLWSLEDGYPSPAKHCCAHRGRWSEEGVKCSSEQMSEFVIKGITYLDSGFLLISRMYLILPEAESFDFGCVASASWESTDEDHRSLIPLAVVPIQHSVSGNGSGGRVEKWRIPEKGLTPTAFSACTRTLWARVG